MTPSTPSESAILEALAWADQPLDRCIEKDLPALKAFHVLAQAYRAAIAERDADRRALERSQACDQKHLDYAKEMKSRAELAEAALAQQKEWTLREVEIVERLKKSRDAAEVKTEEKP